MASFSTPCLTFLLWLAEGGWMEPRPGVRRSHSQAHGLLSKLWVIVGDTRALWSVSSHLKSDKVIIPSSQCESKDRRDYVNVWRHIPCCGFNFAGCCLSVYQFSFTFAGLKAADDHQSSPNKEYGGTVFVPTAIVWELGNQPFQQQPSGRTFPCLFPSWALLGLQLSGKGSAGGLWNLICIFVTLFSSQDMQYCILPGRKEI